MKLSEFFKHDFQDTEDDPGNNFRLFDSIGNVVYVEFYNGWWAKHKYNALRKLINKECSDGYWWKQEYDSDGNETVYTCSDDKYSIQHGD